MSIGLFSPWEPELGAGAGNGLEAASPCPGSGAGTCKVGELDGVYISDKGEGGRQTGAI